VIRAVTLAAIVAAAGVGPAAAADDAGAPPPKGRRVVRGARAPRAAEAGSREPVAEASLHHPPGLAAVVHVTAARAYLDAGAEQGLAPGQKLRLLRGGAVAAGCEVDAVAPRHATCRPDGPARRGDLVRLSLGAPPAAPRPLPPLVPADELDRRAAAIAALPQPKVEAKAAPLAPVELATRRGEVALSHAAWASSGQGPWHQERLDATLRGVPAFAGLVLDADVRAQRWTTRPASFRERPRERTQLYVYEAALASRDPARAWTGAFGRVLPASVPGATTFDGGQVALASASRRAELGLFGGLVPDPITLAPTADRSTAGVYGTLDLGSGALSSRSQARAAVVTSPELGTRFEGEVRSFALLGRTVNVEGMARAGVGGRHQAQYALDLAQLDLFGRPVPRLALSGLFRYAGLDVPDAVAPALFPGHERRWDGSAGWELGPALLSASGGWGQDLSTGLERWFAGPELAFPRAFGPRGGLSLGYAEERGWIAGRTAWLQTAVRAGPQVRLTGRLTWTEDTRPRGDGDHALGVFAAGSADLTRWLAVNGSVLARIGMRAGVAGFHDQATGITALVGVASRF
jgi:hypothetical protein